MIVQILIIILSIYINIPYVNALIPDYFSYRYSNTSERKNCKDQN